MPPGLREDSTRPTRILGKLTVRRKPKTPWAAISLGVLLGLAICAGGVAWRLGYVDEWLTRARPQIDVLRARATTSTTVTGAGAPHGPLAKRAKIRVTTEPPGADVLEVQGGLPRLLGVTPITLDWDVDAHPRELLLRKEGYTPSAAAIAPPAKAFSEPVWVDVEAVLRPR